MNCNCTCYPFPHRPLGGRCDGAELWRRIFEAGAACSECTWHRVFTETHPYGETVTRETLRDCIAPGCRYCPAVAECARVAA